MATAMRRYFRLLEKYVASQWADSERVIFTSQSDIDSYLVHQFEFVHHVPLPETDSLFQVVGEELASYVDL